MMDSIQREELLRTEQQIKDACPAKDDYDQYRIVKNLSGKDKDYLRSLLNERRRLLNRMLLCTPGERARMKDVNDRLFDLTETLYKKSYNLYIGLLQTGYDQEFDDDIMIEGTLSYIADSWEEGQSILSMEEDKEYGSDFIRMMNLICDLDEDNRALCAHTFLSFNPNHNPEMTAKDLSLENHLDDGVSWDHAGWFEGFCICHAIYSLTSDNLFSFPDVLRMNDFWCEVKVTHQLLTDLKGKRYSNIINRSNR